MVLAIISASLSAVMFSMSMPGIFIGRGDEYPSDDRVSYCITTLHSMLVDLQSSQ